MQATIANEEALFVKVTLNEPHFQGQPRQSNILRQSSPRTAFQTTTVFKQGMIDPAAAGAQLRPPTAANFPCTIYGLVHRAVVSLHATLLLSAEGCFKPLLSLCQGARLTNHLSGLEPTPLQRLLRTPFQKGSEVDLRLLSLILMKMCLVEQCLVIGDNQCMLQVQRLAAIP